MRWKDSQPLFETIANDIRRLIHEGALEPGSRIGSAADVAAEHRVNVNTALRSLRLLADEGLIDLRPGLGATVLPQPDLAELNERISALLDEADAQGVTLGHLFGLISIHTRRR